MTAAPATAPSAAYDPDDFRMTVGEHLEELRRRILYALVGLAVIFGTCLIFGQKVMGWFCAPLIRVQLDHEINPQIYYTGVGDVFGVYVRVSLIVAAALAAPWIAYQLWQFVAAGLYPSEKKIVTRYIPLSIGLLIGGMAFVYWVVLPMTLTFFIEFSGDVKMPQGMLDSHPVATTLPFEQRVQIPSIAGDILSPRPLEFWFDSTSGRFKIAMPDGHIRVLQLLPETLTAPMITLPDYIEMVITMLLLFGLSFQLPIVVMAVLRAGLVEMAQMKSIRRYVYLILTIVACAITPGDMITASIALLVPLAALYELGLVLGRKPKELAVT